MVVALQFVNRPEAVDSIYNKQLAMEKIDSLNCLTCEYRFYTKGMADIALGKPEIPIEMFGKYASVKEFYWVKDVLLYAYVRTGQQDKIDEILNTVKLTGNTNIWRDKCLLLGKQFLLQGKKEASDAYLDLLLGSFDLSDAELKEVEMEQKAMAHFYKGDFPIAVRFFEELVEVDPDDIDNNAFLAMSLWKTGRTEKAEEVMEKLERLRTDYQYGAIDYARARYFASTGDADLTIQHLIRAVAAGKRYNPGTFQDDVLMRPYKEMDAFKNVLTFWH